MRLSPRLRLLATALATVGLAVEQPRRARWTASDSPSRLPTTIQLVGGRPPSCSSVARDGAEPRFQVTDGPDGPAGLRHRRRRAGRPAQPRRFDGGVLGFPLREHQRRPGRHVHACRRCSTATRRSRARDGHTVKLPMDRGEGQQWNRAPGNLYSHAARRSRSIRARAATVAIDARQGDPADPGSAGHEVRQARAIQSERLTKFWGRPMYLGAHVLLPEGFDTHPNARYPLVINHGHFPHDFDGFREEPPDPNLKPRVLASASTWRATTASQQEHAYQFYKDWTGPDFPRVLVDRDPARQPVLRRLATR